MQSFTNVLPWAATIAFLGTVACAFARVMLPGVLMRRTSEALRSEIRVETAESLDKQFDTWLAPTLWVMIVGAFLAGAGIATAAVALIIRFV